MITVTEMLCSIYSTDVFEESINDYFRKSVLEDHFSFEIILPDCAFRIAEDYLFKAFS